MIASHAMVVEVACHFGGPRYILRVFAMQNLTSDQLKELLIEAVSAVVGTGCIVISLICDNWNTNRSVYSKLGEPGSCPVLSIQEQSMFLVLKAACQIISTCAWQVDGGRKLKLTKQAAEAFTVSTRNNVDAAKLLLADKDFDYVLPAINADEALERFFGQARQKRGRNFYIEVVDIMAAAKIVNLQTLSKHDIIPESSSRVLDCDKNCTTFENLAE
ncbi:hypothetical protein LOD99_9243 [Oopsacas minuta]|uniref:Transposable element P transposase-like RNase H domain-containing protein n=1 Tax=Oopsacas minuta TaxID=111878 RepID=A0AAV7JC65_9METZ|nr:hypothetical protein LOD99_9243 [Oopsacas minuta]